MTQLLGVPFFKPPTRPSPLLSSLVLRFPTDQVHCGSLHALDAVRRQTSQRQMAPGAKHGQFDPDVRLPGPILPKQQEDLQGPQRRRIRVSGRDESGWEVRVLGGRGWEGVLLGLEDNQDFEVDEGARFALHRRAMAPARDLQGGHLLVVRPDRQVLGLGATGRGKGESERAARARVEFFEVENLNLNLTFSLTLAFRLIATVNARNHLLTRISVSIHMVTDRKEPSSRITQRL